MLSFTPGQKLENELRVLQGTLVETYKNIEGLSPEEAEYLHRFALISNIGASTRIENAVLTDQEVEWVDTILQKMEKQRHLKKTKYLFWTSLKRIENAVSKRWLAAARYFQLFIFKQKSFFL